MGKKETKRFYKQLRKQIDTATAGTRYTLDASTGEITKDEPKGKKQKPAEEPTEETVKAPAFDPEPVITSEGQRTGRRRAALQEMLYGLNRFI